MGGGAVYGVQLRLIECASSNYYSSTPNSTWKAAVIQSNGEWQVSANALVLSAAPVSDQFGIFFYGDSQLAGGAGLPFGNGLRCVGSGGSTLYRLPVVLASANTLAYAVDFGLPTGAGGAITPGSTWHFQAWFRDPAAGGASFDLSDGLSVQFH
ncbi:MAG: hypothetical protein ACI835_000872 [Planctomycetota bacterium]